MSRSARFISILCFDASHNVDGPYWLKCASSKGDFMANSFGLVAIGLAPRTSLARRDYERVGLLSPAARTEGRRHYTQSEPPAIKQTWARAPRSLSASCRRRLEAAWACERRRPKFRDGSTLRHVSLSVEDTEVSVALFGHARIVASREASCRRTDVRIREQESRKS